MSRSPRRDVVFYMPPATPLLLHRFELPGGGAENQILILARALAARGHAVGIVAFDAAGGLVPRIDGVEVIPQPLPTSTFPIVRTLQFYAQALRVLHRKPAHVLVQKAGGIHTVLTAIAARLGRCRFVYASAGVHDFDYSAWERRRWIAALYGLAVRLADDVVAETEEQAKLCRTRYGRAPTVIKTVAEPAPQRTGVGEEFLWIGRLSTHKQPLAYAELARATPQARFRMVAVPAAGGESAELGRELQLLARSLPNLELDAPRPREELGPLIDRAVAIVNTSRSEGMPNAFFEGWSRGVPSLAMSHDPDGAIEREGLGGYAAGSSERMAQLAASMWASRTDQHELSERCRRFVIREHSLGPIVEAWERTLALEHDRPRPHRDE